MKPESRNPNAANELAIRNRQRTIALNTVLLRRIALHALVTELHVSDYQLGIHLVDAPEMARANERYLQHTGSTDVITFDLGDSAHGASGPLRGEIFISIPDAIAQAREFGTTWQSELARYVVHGLLHLRGYDDVDANARRIMKREENRLVKILERSHPLADLGRRRA